MSFRRATKLKIRRPPVLKIVTTVNIPQTITLETMNHSV